VKIEPVAALALQAVIENDLRLIGEMNRQLDALTGGGINERDVVTVAYLLHNLYSVLENSFAQISRTFENHIVDPARWHRELLSKMFLVIPSVRPAVLPENIRPLLHEMLRFRHLFRHSYDFQLDATKLRALCLQWQGGSDSVAEALRTFGRTLAAANAS
jgi:hypothetical protein